MVGASFFHPDFAADFFFIIIILGTIVCLFFCYLVVTRPDFKIALFSFPVVLTADKVLKVGLIVNAGFYLRATTEALRSLNCLILCGCNHIGNPYPYSSGTDDIDDKTSHWKKNI